MSKHSPGKDEGKVFLLLLQWALTTVSTAFWICLSIYLLWLIATGNTIVMMSSDSLECRTHMLEHEDYSAEEKS